MSINWKNAKAWAKSLRTTKLGQHKNELCDNRENPTRACCLGILQLETQGRSPMSFAYGDYLDEEGSSFLGCRSNMPRLFGVLANALNDFGIIFDKAGIEPLTFDEIADLIEIACMEKWGIE